MLSKKLTETQIREIARNEAKRIVARAFQKLKDDIGSTPQQADGNVNARDLYDTIERAEQGIRDENF